MRGPRIAGTLATCAVLGAFAAACGGDDSGATTATTTDDAVPSTTTDDGVTPAADIEVTEPTSFTSPTGNIGCVIAIERASVRCDISDADWKPPKPPPDCDLDFGQGIELPAGGAPALVCAGDTTLGSGDPLPYGDSIAAGLLRCESAESGMTCRDTESGRGFTLSRQSYELR